MPKTVRNLRFKALLAVGTSLLLVPSLILGGVAGARAAAPQSLPKQPSWSDTFTTLNPATWAGRGLNGVIPNRRCGLPIAANSKVSKGVYSATVAKATASQKKQIIAAQKKTRGTKSSCKYGYFTNASLSTDGKFSVKGYGKVEATVKFPVSQGMHFAVWLQSSTGPEIDMIESFGYGKGITNYVHLKTPAGPKRYPAKTTYVLGSQTKKKSWWGKYHTFSVTWTPSTKPGYADYVFKADGKTTWKSSLRTPKADYFLVLSSASSDWELKYLKKPSKGKAKGVKKATLPSRMYVKDIKVWQWAG